MKFVELEPALDWLNHLENPNPRENLDRIECAMAFFDNPHEGLPIIHITGTNGKGSTTNYLKDLFLSQGLSVGMFTSPHIMKFNERFSFNGEPISDEDLLELINQMVDLDAYMQTTEYGSLVFFELYTIMMALYFQKKQPDVCLIEVGIGGYRDTTNVFVGEISVITTVGLDHQDKLGSTVEEVAEEKSGIIKQGSTVIIGAMLEQAKRPIREKVERESAHLLEFGIDFFTDQVENLQAEGSSFDLLMYGERENWHIQMLGVHQVTNASMALAIFATYMQKHGLQISLERAKAALRASSWMARMEKVHEKPLIYIDGAHNVQGLIALRKMLVQYFPDKTVTMLYAGLSSKNQGEQIPFLKEFNLEKLYLTQFDHEKAMSDEEFELVNTNDLDYEFVDDWQGFIDTYLGNQATSDLLLITGSLYFSSHVRQYILK
ncbi:bifunctional folylpolyglutamate synthase/dihydrofolate synthase [Suicoccus acidiformans]|uniref:tetrahydrofolate synthase n=1 Tax=Suicoccus acidiformans TaxID=2036206 RepID=A0A347WMK5_9LACT|nr:folylpolyglutamate synthase/dihydrofolate synthase family protein [Suicoccus acidiformans]AXY26312.1 bifunctional folylpolyglutamate synthase/dihydrofolate synthase [Suicoccus acidiformans]